MKIAIKILCLRNDEGGDMRRTIIYLLLGMLPFLTNAQQPVLPHYAKDKSLGVVNCANSLCHGSVQVWKDSNVLQNEYVTWSRVDKHARAYKILFNETSQRIARNLGLKEAAHEAKICLDCHTHNIPQAQRGERFKLSDGVSCEACHGPGERWLEKHVEEGASHDANLKAGLYPLSDPLQRARLCLSCHFGTGDKFVTHRIMGAGHPRMSFELDTFTTVSPAHFKVDSDWEKRKRLWDGVKVWALGQALAVSEQLAALTDAKRGRDGLFPELVLFDCHACHHPMSERKWTPRLGIGPGVVRLNDSNLLMLRQIAKQIDAGLAGRLIGQTNRLHQALARGGDPLAEARALQSMISELLPRIEKHTFSESDMRGMLAGLIDEGLNGQYSDYAGAEQATMAITSVVNFMHKRGLVKSLPAINSGLAALQAAVANDERYRQERFQAALRTMRSVVQ